MIIVVDTLVKWNTEDRARRTCPAGITIGPSHAFPGGLGVWTEKDFEKDSIFGPLEGDLVDIKNLTQLTLAVQEGYAWQIYTDGELSHCIDGSDEKKSNWLRYVKFARSKEESNVIAFEQLGKVYHGTTKPIVSGTEILVAEEPQFYATPSKKRKESRKSTGEIICTKLHIDDIIPCDECAKVFFSGRALFRHLESKQAETLCEKLHERKLRAPADEAASPSVSQDVLLQDEKHFMCKTCKKGFASKKHLRVHELTHQTYPCKQCDKEFSQSGFLKRHVHLVHEKHLKYACSLCDAKFGQAWYLKRHMTKHSGVRTHNCPHCGKKFKRADVLKIHERTHTGEQPYKCKYCLMSFRNRTSHLEHTQRKHTHDFPHICSKCKKGYCQKRDLAKHEKKCH
ncbi:unnamed protein product [Clavelina lepadiformis]|uniref:C2H2-type domain-containing protein n=1 Tax=Clavelina lepadiformis TaxID=159417 RepID=A0ABP0GUQ4_CLALP